MRIYLIGFMGSGKTTLGQLISEKSGVTFLDTDAMIEAQHEMSIAGIFETRGENGFREIEADVLRQTNFHEKALIATGGGLPAFFENMDWMNHHGVTIYLSWPTETLKINLLKETNHRPLLQHLHPAEATMKIDMMLEERKPFYEMASITLDLTGDIENDFLTLERACNYIW